jgi:sugar phosphate isomerase/epimerase
VRKPRQPSAPALFEVIVETDGEERFMEPLRLVAHTFGFVWQQDAVATVEMLGRHGFHAIEFLAAPGHIDIWAPPSATATRLKLALDSVGSTALALDISSHDYNLASLDERVVDFSLTAYGRLIDLASELGAPWVTVHGGRRIGFYPPPEQRQWEALRRSFQRLVAMAERRRVHLLIENIVPALLNTAAKMNQFVTEGAWENVSFIYDVANGAAAGEDPIVALASILPTVEMVHLSDCVPGRHEHAPIGSGTIDFTGIASLLTANDYTGHVVLEICSATPAHDLVAGKIALRERGWSFRE